MKRIKFANFNKSMESIFIYFFQLKYLNKRKRKEKKWKDFVVKLKVNKEKHLNRIELMII